MDFTYKIENYIASEQRLFVVYTPTDSTLLSYGAWVGGITDDMSEEEIINKIIKTVPLSSWNAPENAIAVALVGTANTGSYTATIAEPSIISSHDIRVQRNLLLEESDWTQLPDAVLSEAEKTSWTTYRQALRDITEQETFPDNVVWPTTP